MNATNTETLGAAPDDLAAAWGLPWLLGCSPTLVREVGLLSICIVKDGSTMDGIVPVERQLEPISLGCAVEKNESLLASSLPAKLTLILLLEGLVAPTPAPVRVPPPHDELGDLAAALGVLGRLPELVGRSSRASAIVLPAGVRE